MMSITSIAQNVPIYKTNDLLKRIHNSSDTTYIVNFWATWCKPCVAELPEFEKMHLQKKDSLVKVILVCMDFKVDLDKKVKPFIQKNQYKSEVVLFDESNANEFINKIDSTWSGAIPATIITYRNKTYYHFIEKKLTFDYLQEKIKH
jgi:thiol-disulfide isomerase/thioredoxin